MPLTTSRNRRSRRPLMGSYSILTKCLTRLGIICLEPELDDAAPPDGTSGGDFLIHKPGIGCVQRIRCHRRVVTPAFRVVRTRAVESGASHSRRTRRDSRVGAQLARQPYLWLRSGACIGRSPGHETIACVVCGNGCVEVIRRCARKVKTALTNCIGGSIEPVELRCGETSESDRMGLPKIVTALGAGIHKSRVACVQKLGRSRLSST